MEYLCLTESKHYTLFGILPTEEHYLYYIGQYNFDIDSQEQHLLKYTTKNSRHCQNAGLDHTNNLYPDQDKAGKKIVFVQKYSAQTQR
ncbi:hypothetical protein DSECCO2_606080 [anaerobic digester metagenome]